MALKIDRRKLEWLWHCGVLAVSGAVGVLAMYLPEYRAELGKYGGFVLVAVKVIDYLLNKMPSLPKFPQDPPA